MRLAGMLMLRNLPSQPEPVKESALVHISDALDPEIQQVCARFADLSKTHDW